jgi:hypothetical protein
VLILCVPHGRGARTKKDRHGIPLVLVSEVKAFRFSTYFKRDIPELSFTVHKLLGDEFTSIRLEISTKLFQYVIFMFAKKSEVLRSFTEAPYTPDNFDSIEVKVADGFQSPEDRRLEEEASLKREAAEEERQKRLAAEQKKREVEERALAAKEKAAAERKEAEERRRIRGNCALIYGDTADKKIKDLTVREEQLVRACQALGLYPPQ